MSKNTTTKNSKTRDGDIKIKEIQDVKRIMVKAFSTYLSEHDIKNKKGIALMIKEFDDMNYSKFLSGKMVSGGTRAMVSLRTQMSSPTITQIDYCAFIIFFGGIIGSVLIYQNYLDFDHMIQDSDIQNEYLSYLARLDAEESACGEIPENNDEARANRDACIVRAPLMISLYQTLYYFKLLFLNTPNTALNFTRGITSHLSDRMKMLALKHADEIKIKMSDTCISGMRTGLFSMAWGMVSNVFPVNPPPDTMDTMQCIKDVTMTQLGILSVESHAEITLFMRKITTTIDSIRCLTSWTAAAFTMSIVYFIKRYRGFGMDMRHMIADHADYIRAQNMGLIEASAPGDPIATHHGTQRMRTRIRTAEEYSRLRIFELQDELRKRGLRVAGKKSALIERLVSANAASGASVQGGSGGTGAGAKTNNKTRKKKKTRGA